MDLQNTIARIASNHPRTQEGWLNAINDTINVLGINQFQAANYLQPYFHVPPTQPQYQLPQPQLERPQIFIQPYGLPQISVPQINQVTIRTIANRHPQTDQGWEDAIEDARRTLEISEDTAAAYLSPYFP
jgi:hypothetical protein